MQLFELFATLGLDTRDFNSQIGRATESGRSFASKLSGGLSKTMKTVAVIGTAAVGTVGAAFIKMGKDALSVFADLEQNIGGSEAVFGRWAQVIQKAGTYAFKNVGLAQDQYLAEANKMGSLLQSMGIAKEDSSKMTIDWMQRAADVASVMGIDVESAMQAIEGAAKGAANGIIYLINQVFGTNIPSIREIRWPTWDDVKRPRPGQTCWKPFCRWRKQTIPPILPGLQPISLGAERAEKAGKHGLRMQAEPKPQRCDGDP